MRPCLLIVVCVLALAPAVSAAEQSDILRYIPRQAEAAIVVDHPRQLVNALTGFEPFRQLLAFPAIQEQLDSTNSRRAKQLVDYYEKALGYSWPELLDRLAGGGAALTFAFDNNPPPALLVVKAKDEALLHKAFGLVLDVAKSELERTESAQKIREVTYRGFAGYQIGKDVFAAVAGPVLFVANKSEPLHAGLNLYINGAHESLARTGKPEAARAMLPPNPLSWIYIDLDRAHRSSEGQAAYRYPRGDPGQIVLLQGMLDVIGKSPYVAIGNYQTPEGFRSCVRMAAGRDATPAGLGLHLPPEGQPGSLPLLEPKNVLFTTSFYLDLGKLWTEREKLLSEQLRKGLEDADKNLGQFLAGKKFADLLTSVGPYHRLVVVAQEKAGYKIQPNQLQPAVAFVSDLRNPAYADAMNAVLRAVALFAGGQFNLKMTEEKIGSATLVTYRFPEDGKVPADVNNGRFNTSPCFAKVGNQFLMASTTELGRELVALLQKPEANDPARGSVKTSRMRIDSVGGAEVLRVFEDQLLTQTVLDRAVPVEQARKEARAVVTWLRDLGKLDFEIDYGPSDFRYDVMLKWKAK